MIRTGMFCVSVAALAAVAFSPSDAHACGGFFCGGAGPQQVNQAAERIVFAEHADGRVTAIVQILYSGPADRFGWLLPVPGIPEIGLSSDAAFTAIQGATNPQYQMNTTVEGECFVPQLENSGSNNTVDLAGSVNNTNGNTSPNNVMVVDAGKAGPYDYVVIQIDAASGAAKAQLALDWLETNNYQVTDVGPDLLQPYLDENYNLLAIRLQKSQDAGSVRPIRLTYDTDHPMIPIKLTAVAANADMGVMTWLLGSARAVPVNYKSLELNDALLNWFNPTSNYNDVVIAAANEASGQGFVTEYAADASTLDQVVFTQFDESQWQDLVSQDWTDRRLELMLRAMESYAWNRFDNFGNFVQWDGLPEAFDAALPNLGAEDRMALLECGPNCVWNSEADVPAEFDAAAFLAALNDFVVGPMRDTQDLIDEFAYVTRMYTTMSAHEMTLDPSFDYNPDLEDVSNIHTANRIVECHPDLDFFDAPWRVELPSGLLVRGVGSAWPINPDPMLPATLTVKQDSTSGEGEVVRDNVETVRQFLEEANSNVPTAEEIAAGMNMGNNGNPGGGGGGEQTDDEPLGEKKIGGGGCATASGSGSLWLLLGVALVALRRRV